MIKARIFKIIPENKTLDIEIEGDNIFYCQNELGRNKERVNDYWRRNTIK
jgi:hypothetical protein